MEDLACVDFFNLKNNISKIEIRILCGSSCTMQMSNATGKKDKKDIHSQTSIQFSVYRKKGTTKLLNQMAHASRFSK